MKLISIYVILVKKLCKPSFEEANLRRKTWQRISIKQLHMQQNPSKLQRQPNDDEGMEFVLSKK